MARQAAATKQGRGSGWRRLRALGLLLVVALGPPALLGALWGLPGRETVEMVASADQWRGGADEALVAVLATLAWLAWAWMAASMAVETVQLRRGKAKEDANGLRRGLRPLLAAVVLKGALAGTALTATVGASEAMAHPHVEAPADMEEQQPQTAAAMSAYEVVSGDTLWDIAVEHLGDGLRWREIHNLSKEGAQAHRGKITDPNLIFPGDIVLLPADAAKATDPPGYEKVARVYGHTIASETAAPQAGAPIELESLGETFMLLESQLQVPQPTLEPVAELAVEPVEAAVAQETPQQAEPVTAVELAARVQDDGAGLAEPEAEPELTASELVAEAGLGEATGDEVYGHSMSMGQVAQIALGSASLLTVGGLGVIMLKRRRRGAALRGPGETVEPLRDAAGEMEREVLSEVEEAVPWAEWLAAMIADFASRRPAGGPRVQLAEGSNDGVELLLSGRDDGADWGPWHVRHGRKKTVLSLKRGTEGLRDEIDGWEALPLLLTIGERLILNFEAAGVVSVVAADEETGLGTEAARGLCRAIIAEVTCRMAECEVEVWATETSQAALGAAVEHRSVKVLAASEIDEEVSEQWRDAASRRTQAMLADLKLSVDDDRRDGVGVGSHLVVCTSADAEDLAETLRIAKEATHNLAVLVLGPAETETRIEVSVPAGEMIAHPWGLRVTACYLNDPTAGTIKEMVTEPVRMRPRAPIGTPQRSNGEATAPQRPLNAPQAPASVGPVLSDRSQAPRFSGEHARAERAARQRRRGRGAERQPQRAAGDLRVQVLEEVLNMDAKGASRNMARGATSRQEQPQDDEKPAVAKERAKDQGDAVVGEPVSEEGAEDEDGADVAESEDDQGDAMVGEPVSEEGAEDEDGADVAESEDDQGDAVVGEPVSEEGAEDEDGADVAESEDDQGDAVVGEPVSEEGAEDEDGADVAESEDDQGDAGGVHQGSLLHLAIEDDDSEDDEAGLGVEESAQHGSAAGSGAAASGESLVAMVPMGRAADDADEEPAGDAAAPAEANADGEGMTSQRQLGAHNNGGGGEQLPMPAERLPESMQRVKRRHESSLLRFGPLSDATVQRLRRYRPEARWAVLTAGPLRVARLDEAGSGEVLEAMGEAVATAALLAGSGSLSEEDAQSRLQWGSNELNWSLTLTKLREVFGADFVAEPAAMRLEATVADLMFFEDGFSPEDVGVGLELLRGEVFDSAGELRFDMLVEHSRTLVADWCSTHAWRLVEDGEIDTAEKLVALGLLSQPLDGQLLQADMACCLERGGRAAATARLQQHFDAGDDNGANAQIALDEVMASRGELLKA